MSLQEFHNEFLQEILARAGAAENFIEAVFTELMCETLEEQGVFSDFGIIGYRHSKRGIRLDAWARDDDSESLTLIISEFKQDVDIQRLTQSFLDQAFKRVQKFYSLVTTDTKDFGNSLEESAPVFDVAREIREQSSAYNHIHFILLTNCELGEAVSPPDNQVINQIPCHYDVWDIGRLFRLESSGKVREDILIDLTSYVKDGIACLPAFTGEKGCESYLMVMPGKVLAEIYGKYGERLLEQNVRTFLQFRGKVNKGMRVTIDTLPHMFFSYNNGISATAEKVVTTTDCRNMLSVQNFQIVNGGQTTASIFTAGKKDNEKLSDVYVQVKMSIIPTENVETVVPKISEYANTQNKVNAADFFSNHPFHLRIEEISRRLWAPSPAGTFQQTHWFYERTRGQYVNAQANLTPPEKRKFLSQNPHSQVITKTDLAKLVHTFESKPYWVSLGAQKNFAKFASVASQAWDRNANDINELYYKRIVAKTIIFRTLDKEIMRQEWYACGYKANIVTYVLAKYSRELIDRAFRIDFDRIWKNQAISPRFLELLIATAKFVNKEIQNKDADISNVTEWCKKEICWQRMERAKFDVSYTDAPEIIEAVAAKEEEVDARRDQVIVDGINAQTIVVEKGSSYWEKMQQWLLEHSFTITESEEGILQSACNPKRIPSEKQAKILLKIEERVKSEGFA